MEELKLGLDPIVIDPANEWVYDGSIPGTSVYRVRAADLLDEGLSPDALGERVERYGRKVPCDGISIDAAGNNLHNGSWEQRNRSDSARRRLPGPSEG